MIARCLSFISNKPTGTSFKNFSYKNPKLTKDELNYLNTTNTHTTGNHFVNAILTAPYSCLQLIKLLEPQKIDNELKKDNAFDAKLMVNRSIIKSTYDKYLHNRILILEKLEKYFGKGKVKSFSHYSYLKDYFFEYTFTDLHLQIINVNCNQDLLNILNKLKYGKAIYLITDKKEIKYFLKKITENKYFNSSFRKLYNNSTVTASNLPLSINENNDNVIISVLDTGLDYTNKLFHKYLFLKEDLTNFQSLKNHNKKYAGWNFVDDNDNFLDDSGHGTEITSLIIDLSKKQLFVPLSVDFLKVLPLKIHDEGGIGILSEYFLALDFALKNGVSVINQSFSFNGDLFTVHKEIIDILTEKAIILVQAVGNIENYSFSCDQKVKNLNRSTTLFVGSVDSTLTSSKFNCLNDDYVIMAKGEDVSTISLSNKMKSRSGTSYSVAFVTFTSSVIKYLLPKASIKLLHTIIYSTSSKYFNTQRKLFSKGLLNVDFAIFLTARIYLKLVDCDIWINNSSSARHVADKINSNSRYNIYSSHLIFQNSFWFSVEFDKNLKKICHAEIDVSTDKIFFNVDTHEYIESSLIKILQSPKQPEKCEKSICPDNSVCFMNNAFPYCVCNAGKTWNNVFYVEAGAMCL